ncbi:MAG: 2-amino-4-hydroxy-6-hydroxymethyldihydropteridine diphosphokinase [Bacteroidales bacterium]|nr:2-amino-4-hydroxy-6-hydroxymethyldihydropteridine diphosphokinase [Bacteroidales bacterium]
MGQKNLVVILLGANLGDKKEMFRIVEDLLEQHVGECVNKSSIYSSQAWGFDSPQEFYNQVLVIETEFPAHETLLRCQAIEKKCGRTRHANAGYEDRVIDIDILYFNNDIIDTDDLVVPHPLLHQRRFTMEPLCEVLPNYVHPILIQTNEQLLRSCIDKNEVHRI